MFAAGALVALIAAMTVSFDPHEVWERVEWANGAMPTELSGIRSAGSTESASMRAGMLTGMKVGLISCESCGLLSRPVDINEPGQCPRCGAELALRKHNTIQRSWAFIIAALICFIPANLLPVMVSTTLVGSEDDTIISGVILLYKTGSWHLALIVLIASIVIPLAKIMALAYLLVTVQRHSIKEQRERLKLYRLVEFVGRWSMLDVFVITFTVALIQLQPLMSIKPGAGVLFFAAVVVLTMVGAETFDPRLIWDSSKEQGGKHD
jgi:paraquat-inducible protein A